MADLGAAKTNKKKGGNKETKINFIKKIAKITIDFVLRGQKMMMFAEKMAKN